MNKSDRMYNIYLLANTTGLNVDDGIRQSGSRRAYFNELNDFENSAPPLLEGLLEKRPKKELTEDLGDLLQLLLSINDTGISNHIEKALILLKQNGDQNIIDEKLYQIQKKTLYLLKMLRETGIGAQSDEPNKTEAGKAGADSKDEQSAAQRIEVVPRPAFFVDLKEYIDNFDTDAALNELKTISDFSYGAEIDKALDRISKYLSDFDYEKNAEEIEKIMSLASKPVRPDKKVQKKKKILAIDDMPDILSTLKSLLKDDYTVYCVTTHLAALKFLTTNAPDLILIDIEMPEMDGFTLAKIIRQMDRCKRTPIVFLTGNVSVENIMASIESGGNDFIKKPIDYKILASKIKKNLKNDIDI